MGDVGLWRMSLVTERVLLTRVISNDWEMQSHKCNQQMRNLCLRLIYAMQQHEEYEAGLFCVSFYVMFILRSTHWKESSWAHNGLRENWAGLQIKKLSNLSYKRGLICLVWVLKRIGLLVLITVLQLEDAKICKKMKIRLRKLYGEKLTLEGAWAGDCDPYKALRVLFWGRHARLSIKNQHYRGATDFHESVSLLVGALRKKLRLGRD